MHSVDGIYIMSGQHLNKFKFKVKKTIQRFCKKINNLKIV